MEDIRSIALSSLEGRMGGIAYQLTRVHFASLQRRGSWNPAINAYRCRDGFVICVELAGVDRSLIDLRVEPRRVFIGGQRQPPEPDGTEGPLLQVLALEIDHGPFEREVVLPLEVVPEKAQAEQRNGMLWIYLPLPAQAPSQGQIGQAQLIP
jgi:HSP20 family protein